MTLRYIYMLLRRAAIVLMLSCMAAVSLNASEDAEKNDSPKTPAGVIRVYTFPQGADLYVDGIRASDKTPVEVEVSPGLHELRLEMKGYDGQSHTVDIADGETVKLEVMMQAVPGHAMEDRKDWFRGGYISAGGGWTHILLSDVMLSDTVGLGSEINLGDEFQTSPGISLQVRYIRPIEDWGFMIVDTSYMDARLRKSNIRFPGPAGKVNRIDLLLFRGAIDFSVGPNYFNYLLPYLGAGFHYTVLVDTDQDGWFGGDNQEDFNGYSAKAGLLWNSRQGLVAGVEYRYNWSYKLEDYLIVGMVGYHF